MLRRRLLWSSLLFAVALGLAVGAVAFHSTPNLLGFSGQDVTRELDFWCALGSSGIALGVGIKSLAWGLEGTQPPIGSILAGGIVWLGLTPSLLFGVWGPHVLFYALMLAPTHALASIGLFVLARRYRREADHSRMRERS